MFEGSCYSLSFCHPEVPGTEMHKRACRREGGEKQKTFCYKPFAFLSRRILARNSEAKTCDKHYWCQEMVLVLEAIKKQQDTLLKLIFKEDLSPFSMPSELCLTSPGLLHTVWLRGCFLTSKKSKCKKLVSGLLPHARPPGLLESHHGIPSSLLLAT